MSRFTTVDAATSIGATDDMFTRNALACAGTGGLIGVGVGSVLTVAAVIPMQVGLAVGASGAAVYVVNLIADGKSINPFAKEDGDKTEAKPAAEAAA